MSPVGDTGRVRTQLRWNHQFLLIPPLFLISGLSLVHFLHRLRADFLNFQRLTAKMPLRQLLAGCSWAMVRDWHSAAISVPTSAVSHHSVCTAIFGALWRWEERS